MKYAVFAFPSGATGAGLMSLRGALAVSLVTAGLAHPFALSWLPPGLYVLAAAVLIGLQTRLAAGLAVAAVLGLAICNRNWTAPVITQVLNAAALTMLGPGALSLDALRFGRRTFHLPK